jgi:hypothetical protein
MRLEELWNDAIAEHGIRLLCSYESHGLAPETFELLPSLTHGHSLLIPVEDYARLDRAVARALIEVCGDDTAALSGTMGRREPPLHMPKSTAIVHALRRTVPYFGDRVAAKAKEHYDADEDA